MNGSHWRMGGTRTQATLPMIPCGRPTPRPPLSIRCRFLAPHGASVTVMMAMTMAMKICDI